jgi:hypothetical protein
MTPSTSVTCTHALSSAHTNALRAPRSRPSWRGATARARPRKDRRNQVRRRLSALLGTRGSAAYDDAVRPFALDHAPAHVGRRDELRRSSHRTVVVLCRPDEAAGVF